MRVATLLSLCVLVLAGIFAYERYGSSIDSHALIFDMDVQGMKNTAGEYLADSLSDLLAAQGMPHIEPYIIPAGVTTSHSYDRIIVPSSNDQEQAAVRELISNTALKKTFRVYKIPRLPTPDPTHLEFKNKAGEKITVEPESLLSEKDVHFASLEGQYGYGTVKLHLTKSGTHKLRLLTEKVIGDSLALVLDDVVVGTPAVHERVTTGVLVVSQYVPESEGKDLAFQLSLHSLKRALEQTTTAPSASVQ